jgi:hypothetical protein
MLRVIIMDVVSMQLTVHLSWHFDWLKRGTQAVLLCLGVYQVASGAQAPHARGPTTRQVFTSTNLVKTPAPIDWSVLYSPTYYLQHRPLLPFFSARWSVPKDGGEFMLVRLLSG